MASYGNNTKTVIITDGRDPDRYAGNMQNPPPVMWVDPSDNPFARFVDDDLEDPTKIEVVLVRQEAWARDIDQGDIIESGQSRTTYGVINNNAYTYVNGPGEIHAANAVCAEEFIIEQPQREETKQLVPNSDIMPHNDAKGIREILIENVSFATEGVNLINVVPENSRNCVYYPGDRLPPGGVDWSNIPGPPKRFDDVDNPRKNAMGVPVPFKHPKVVRVLAVRGDASAMCMPASDMSFPAIPMTCAQFAGLGVVGGQMEGAPENIPIAMYGGSWLGVKPEKSFYQGESGLPDRPDYSDFKHSYQLFPGQRTLWGNKEANAQGPANAMYGTSMENGELVERRAYMEVTNTGGHVNNIGFQYANDILFPCRDPVEAIPPGGYAEMLDIDNETMEACTQVYPPFAQYVNPGDAFNGGNAMEKMVFVDEQQSKYQDEVKRCGVEAMHARTGEPSFLDFVEV